MRYFSRILEDYFCYTFFGDFMRLSEAIKLRIIELCNINKLNVNSLSNMAGINPSTIRSILKSRCNTPNTQTIYYICLALNIELKDFFNSKLFSNLDDD